MLAQTKDNREYKSKRTIKIIQTNQNQSLQEIAEAIYKTTNISEFEKLDKVLRQASIIPMFKPNFSPCLKDTMKSIDDLSNLTKRLSNNSLNLKLTDLSSSLKEIKNLQLDLSKQAGFANSLFPKLDTFSLTPKLNTVSLIPKLNTVSLIPKLKTVSLIPKLNTVSLIPEVAINPFPTGILTNHTDATIFLPKVDSSSPAETFSIPYVDRTHSSTVISKMQRPEQELQNSPKLMNRESAHLKINHEDIEVKKNEWLAHEKISEISETQTQMVEVLLQLRDISSQTVLLQKDQIKDDNKKFWITVALAVFAPFLPLLIDSLSKNENEERIIQLLERLTDKNIQSIQDINMDKLIQIPYAPFNVLERNSQHLKSKIKGRH